MDRPLITVCGLGPGGLDRVTDQTRSVLAEARVGFVRTRRHPSASIVDNFVSFDEIYDRADRFDEVYQQIAQRLVEEARQHGEIVYAVPGSPLVLEQTVRLLRRSALADGDHPRVRALPAISFLDELWARLDVDPVDDGVRLVDGHRFASEAAAERGPLVVAHTHAQWVLSDIKLAVDAGPEQTVVVCQALGTDRERVVEVGWPDLDRVVEADHLTTVYIPEMAQPVGRDLVDGVGLMDRLRVDCPWDRSQDHASLRPSLVEEAAEVLEALDAVVVALDEGDDDAVGAAYHDLEGELGDLWFQILFHSRLAAEAGWFTMGDVSRTLIDKMIGRHPHVFEGADYDPASWAEAKRREREEAADPGSAVFTSVLDEVPTTLPALARASKVLNKVEAAESLAGAGVAPGSDLGSEGELVRAVVDPVADDEVEGVVGRLLLVVAEIARRRGVDPEQALRLSVNQAMDRYRSAERLGTPTDRWIVG